MSVIRIGVILKTSGPKNHIGEIKLHAYPNDLTICRLNYSKQYLEATKQHRGNITSLFITLNKLFKVSSKDRLVRWVKQTIKDAGINMNIFSPPQHAVLVTVKLKLTLSLKQGGGGGTGRSQGFMTNQFFKKNGIVLVY